MATSRHTSRKAARACCSSVSPFRVREALSWPMRVLLPPARTKPDSWEWTIAAILQFPIRQSYLVFKDLLFLPSGRPSNRHFLAILAILAITQIYLLVNTQSYPTPPPPHSSQTIPL